MPRIQFDCNEPDLDVARRIVLNRLREDPRLKQLPSSGTELEPYVELVGSNQDYDLLRQYVCDAFWELVLNRIVVPGQVYQPNVTGGASTTFPWFHLTDYGKRVIATREFEPYDPSGYLKRVRERVTNPDQTVLSYLTESLEALRRGLAISSALALGIAAERIFLLVCQSVRDALTDSVEQAELTKLMKQTSMKPKLDWISKKLDAIQDRPKAMRPNQWPDTAVITVLAIYNLLRVQRNDLGHPREEPPAMSAEQAFVNLQIFPTYYHSAEELLSVLRTNSI